MIEVKQAVKIYEEDDRRLSVGESKRIGVESHYSEGMVILVIGMKGATPKHPTVKRITILGEDLITAIQNAMNTNR